MLTDPDITSDPFVTRPHETNVDAERQGTAPSIAYKQPRQVLHYMGTYRQQFD